MCRDVLVLVVYATQMVHIAKVLRAVQVLRLNCKLPPDRCTLQLSRLYDCVPNEMYV